MLTRKHLLLNVILVLQFGPIAAAKDGSLTLANALARALRGSPEMAAFDWDTRAAEARVLQAGLRPNPELGIEIENATGSGPFRNGDQLETTLSFRQLIELGGKRSARILEAEARRAVVEREYQVKRVEVLKTTTLAFIETLAAQRRLELASEIAKVAEETVVLTNQRMDVGKVSAVEGLRAKLAMSSARIEVEEARRDIATARGILAAQWGTSEADFGAASGDLDRHAQPPPWDELRSRLVRSAGLAWWQAERRRRTAALEKERTVARPDLTLEVGPRILGKAHDATFVAGFSIPWPLGGRNEGNIAEAQANLGKVDAEARAAEARALAALHEAFQKLSGATGEILILEESVIPSAREAEKQLADGYAAGRFTDFEVLDARRTLNAARVQQIRALTDYHKARAEVDALTTLPVEVPRHDAVKRTSAKPAPARRK